MKSTPEYPTILCIGGLDPSGGAGLPADARAAKHFGVHACCVTTAVIAQNTRGVFQVEAVSPQLLQAQLENLLEDIAPRAVKIGMLPNSDSVEIVAACLKSLNLPIILDPVFAPSSGADFSDDATIQSIVAHLFPLCELVTPNLLEAQRLCDFAIIDTQSATEAAKRIRDLGARNILIKGGHAEESDEVCDWLWNGEDLKTFCAPRIGGTEVRGTGCLLASAIAAQRACGTDLETATRDAKMWLTEKIREAKEIGKGRRVAV